MVEIKVTLYSTLYKVLRQHSSCPLDPRTFQSACRSIQDTEAQSAPEGTAMGASVCVNGHGSWWAGVTSVVKRLKESVDLKNTVDI